MKQINIDIPSQSLQDAKLIERFASLRFRDYGSVFIVFLIALFTLVMTVIEAQANDLPPECRYLPAYVEPAGVTYQPGVDVRGRSVVSADINAAPIAVPNVIKVPLTVDIIERVREMGGQFEGLEGQGALGTIDIHKDGLVTYNGQDWSQSFYAICGQEPSDTVLSSDQIEVEPKASAPKTDQERVIFGGDYRD